MNIVILGAGRVGSSIAELLCQGDNNVTVIDNHPDRVKRANDEHDLRAILGSASQSSVLFQAGISSADICLAVTGNDEINIIAASMAKAMGARRCLARVYAPVFRDLSTFDYQRHFKIDRMLSVEHLAAMELARGIRDPGSVVVEQFARSELEVQEFPVKENSKLIGVPIRELGISSNIRFGTILRENKMRIASANDELAAVDRVTVFSRPEEMKSVRQLFDAEQRAPQRVVIAGGGETGLHLARTLERDRFKVLIMEADPDRCTELARLLETTKIINGDAKRREHLEEERVGSADVFVACTGKDEDNLVLGVEAAELGASRIMTVIGSRDYFNLITKLGIHLSVSSRDVMARQVMSYLTRGNVISKTRLPGGLVNVIEIEVIAGSHVTETTLAEMNLPERCLVVALIQQDYVRIPHASDRIDAGDTVIILVEEDVVDQAVAAFTA